MIKEHIKNQIIETAQVEEVIGDFVDLKRRGVNMIGVCPFHDEKTPSFTVSPSKNIYKCFGCGAAGNSVKFLMEHEHMSFPEALKYLAKKYNIEIEEEELTPEVQAEISAKESLFIANQFARDTFKEQLWEHPEGKSIGLTYFKERGFDQQTIEKFQLGYTIDKAQGFIELALQKGYQLDILKKAGLASKKENYRADFFRARVMFPIHNLSGKVLGFGGRTLRQDKKIPKYINTPDSDIYNKSEALYGIYFAKTAIRKHDECFLVEGYTDVISLSQAGVENAVASSGTSLTEGQIKQVKRFSQNITILYDGDAAGIQAAKRGVDLILAQNMNVKVVMLPDGEDPDSYVRSYGGAELLNYVAERKKDFILFILDLGLKAVERDPVQKTALIRDLVSSIALIPDGLKRAAYIGEVSHLLKTGEQLLHTEVNKVMHKNGLDARKKAEREATQGPNEVVEVEISNQPEAHEPTTILPMLERALAFCVMRYVNEPFDDQQNVLEFMQSEIDFEDIKHQDYQSILQFAAQHPNPNPKVFTQAEDENMVKLAIDALTDHYQLSENWQQKHEINAANADDNYREKVADTVYRYQLYQIQQLVEENTKKIKEPSDEIALIKSLKVHQKLKKMEKTLIDKIGDITVFKN